jgi:hypothetical protein
MIENSEGGRDRSKGLHGRNGAWPIFSRARRSRDEDDENLERIVDGRIRNQFSLFK